MKLLETNEDNKQNIKRNSHAGATRNLIIYHNNPEYWNR